MFGRPIALLEQVRNAPQAYGAVCRQFACLLGGCDKLENMFGLGRLGKDHPRPINQMVGWLLLWREDGAQNQKRLHSLLLNPR